MAQKFRNFCYTIFYDNNDKICEKIENQLIKFVDQGLWKFIGYGFEKTKEGNKHIQGYLTLHNPRTFNSLKKDCNEGEYTFTWHVEPCKGSLKDNEKYCKKEGNFKKYGEENKQGERSDLIILRDKLLNNESTLQDLILTECTNNTQIQFLEKIQRNRKGYKGKRYVEWYYGSSGGGKSYIAEKTFEGKNKDIINYVGGFWNGYNGAEYVIINDFRGQCPLNEILNMLDRYEFNINTKGTVIPSAIKHIIITSDRSPKDCYTSYCDEKKEDISQLERRIHRIIKFNKDDVIVIKDEDFNEEKIPEPAIDFLNKVGIKKI